MTNSLTSLRQAKLQRKWNTLEGTSSSQDIGLNSSFALSSRYSSSSLASTWNHDSRAVWAFAWSWGPLGWLVPSEICPLEIRSAGQAINVSLNMLFTFLIAQVFLSAICNIKSGLFFLFAGFVIIMTIVVAKFLPETNNVPIEEINRAWKAHWLWGKYIRNPSSGVLISYQRPKRQAWDKSGSHKI
ncbi:hypothetical protein CRYUN_Cryun04dG0092300 [Craigia yunnanensis]